MRLRPAAALAVLVLIGLAGCSGPPGPPWPEMMAPNAITLRWYPNETTEAAAQQVADAHCAPTGHGAAMTEVERDGSAEIGAFRCR